MSVQQDRPTDARERLLNQFKDHQSHQHGERWDDLWKQNWLPWDRGVPNPALEDVLKDRKELIGEPVEGFRRKKALVPGCGKGYDVLLLASYGYDAYGLEVSQKAVEVCNQFASEHIKEYPRKDGSTEPLQTTFVYGDFFKDDWQSKIEDEPLFDLIYDYTFLSALPPDLRPAWALQMSKLLSPGGVLVCVEFPTYKPPSTGGPPWALPPPVYVAHLSKPGEEVPYNEEGYVIVDEESPKYGDNALQRIAHWQPERTHEIGKGTDWVSVWRHKNFRFIR